MKDFKQFIHTLWDGTKVFLVHGNYVRDNITDEFIGGGHGYQDEEIPEDEIWVEHTEEPADIKEILVHEITEYIFMKYEKEDYDHAHEIANSIEDTIRRIPDYPGEAAPKDTYQKEKENDMKDVLPGNETNTGMVFMDKAGSFNKVSFIVHMPEHKNSSGESAPYVIKSHETNKILSSHKTRGEAEKHLKQMHAHSGLFIGVRNIDELISGGTYEQCNLYRS